jgi:tetratricopeptide (TPR) repeat protein
MERFEKIESKIEKGYASIRNNNYTEGCDLWLVAWEELKSLMEDDCLSDIGSVDAKYPWREFVSNYVQDLEMELKNAGLEDKSYYQRRLTYCRELYERIETDQLMSDNTRRAIAESYFDLGNHEQGEQEFESMIHEDPTFGWAYIGWADWYAWESDEPNFEKAYEILDLGLSQTGLRDRRDVLERGIDYSEKCGNDEKGKYYKKELRQLSSTRVVKVGRNEPCPCGSGKKYKKCCGF